MPSTLGIGVESNVRRRRWPLAVAVCALLIGAAVFTLLPRRGGRPAADLARASSGAIVQSSGAESEPSVRLSQVAAAEFADERTPSIGSSLSMGKSFLLRKGLVELSFPAGAAAIVKAPAVFTIENENRLRLDLGSCSVHAPDGAQGFEVVGPRTRVVDLGTRFSMDVNEVGVADVQVLEGAAKISSVDRPEQSTLLQAGAASQHAATGELHPSRFEESRYQRSLPDRVMKYEAAEATPGAGVRDLEAVIVQRAGRAYRYAADELIGIDVLHFRSDANNSNVLWEETPPADPVETLTKDVALNTGIVNFGRIPKSGSAQAALRDRPGLAIRFREPILNDPGDDLVLIEVHAAIYPPEGDAFLIGPVSPSEGQHTAFVKQYDIGWSSSDARVVAPFQISRYKQLPRSLDDLRTAAFQPSRLTFSLPFRALAVGIDLSDMGLAEGERLTDLFIEDAGDDDSVIDPVFIGGLPPLSRSAGDRPNPNPSAANAARWMRF